MKYLLVLAGVVLVQAGSQFPICSLDITHKYFKCRDSIPLESSYSIVVPGPTLSLTSTHLSICYGDYPQCKEIHDIAITEAGKCYIEVWRSMTANLNDEFRPCENPLPPRLVEKQFCTDNGLILSEFYGQLYADIVRNNVNEHFTYNQTGGVIIAKSNGQCLEGVPNFYGGDATGIKTAPCDLNNIYQRWDVMNNEIVNPSRAGLQAGSPGSLIAVKYPITKFRDCNGGLPIKVHIVSIRGKRISEYYSGLYFDEPRDNTNEVFLWDRNAKLFKSESSQQCLDAFLGANGKYYVHTYPCDEQNPNQKWDVHADTKQIEHVTHKGQCLDGDPTYPDHHLQMWECALNNPNQNWDVLSVP
ncbi:hypothetical protein THRCLA_04886 [Thraustotheca clavata]|uniref:Secreted protein n=1 Tax=Thraustotheca clavata TaxID=74557 RepID=A0A0A7CLE6_9STRA|nr:secreted protein [Thraustotheca clavata]OQS02766.1 hypothetical protein THRCLA_04886 [Thraustotheca clavata]